jgi:beta-lactam-binding protein with PASTA domain
VPKVVGLKLGKAKARIRARHCRVGTIARKHASPRLRGRVIRQRPAAGRTLRKGAKVNLTVGKR